MLTAFEDPNYLTKALRAGAAGYVLKHESGPQVTEAIQKVLGGEVLFDQEVATRLLACLVGSVPKENSWASVRTQRSASTLSLESLSPREVEVLRQVSGDRPTSRSPATCPSA